LRSRVAITSEELIRFSEEQAAGAPDAWQGGDQIIRALYAPFQLS